VYSATLQSPNTWSERAPEKYVEKIIDQFNFSHDDLHPDFIFIVSSIKYWIVPIPDQLFRGVAVAAYDFLYL
jgi:hypothetical protein